MKFFNKKIASKLILQALLITLVLSFGAGYNLKIAEPAFAGILDIDSENSIKTSTNKEFACSIFHTIYKKSDGTVWASGINYSGLGNIKSPTSPVQVPITNVDEIACGNGHTIYKKNDGTVWACGQNNGGQLGIGNTIDQTSPVQVPITNVDEIACGSDYTIYKKNDGTVWACGKNYSGQLGIGNTTNQISPVQVPITNVKKIVCRYTHTFFIKGDGTIWACGDNYTGELGIGNTTNQISIIQVPITNVEEIVSGAGHTFFKKNDGSVWGCGYNKYGQLGTGNTINRTSPVQVPIANVKEITCGQLFTFFKKNDGTVWSCGYNEYGELGISNSTYQTSPRQVDISKVEEITCGENYTIFMKSNGTIWGCGKNDYKQLGAPTGNCIYFPTNLTNYWLTQTEIVAQAVATAESTLLQTDVDAAKALLTKLPEGQDKTELQRRLELVETKINTPLDSIALNKSAINLIEGSSEQLTATTTPEAAQVTWTSSNESIAKVDSYGNVTAINEGNCTITGALSNNLNKASACNVTVTKKPILISLNKTTMNLKEGSSEQLMATTTSAAIQVIWTSSNNSIATVDENGKVEGIREGEATITAQIKDSDEKATCDITVTLNNAQLTADTKYDPYTPNARLIYGNAKASNGPLANHTLYIKYYEHYRDNAIYYGKVQTDSNGNYSFYVENTGYYIIYLPEDETAQVLAYALVTP